MTGRPGRTLSFVIRVRRPEPADDPSADLEFIYNNLCCIRDEINSAVTLLSKLAQINALDDADQSKSLLSKEVQELENQLQILLAQRGSVARPPGLPSESQLVEAEARHQAAEATKAIESPWHPFFQFAEAMPPHYLRQGFPYRGFAEQSWVPGPLPEEKKD